MTGQSLAEHEVKRTEIYSAAYNKKYRIYIIVPGKSLNAQRAKIHNH